MPSTRPIGPSFDYPGDGAGLGLPFVEHVDLRIGPRVAAKKDAQSLDKIFLELGLQWLEAVECDSVVADDRVDIWRTLHWALVQGTQIFADDVVSRIAVGIGSGTENISK
jgi:hypothetical protein